jgi:hypothetical protein
LGLDTGEMGHDSRRNLPRPPDRPRSMRLTFASLLVVVVTACGSGEESTTGGGGQWETFTSDIDGLAVGYPTMWHRAEAPLAAAPVGDQVEVLGLATGDLPEAEQGCSPYPWAAMRALGAGDLVLTLRVSMYVGPFDEWAETGIREPLTSKPDDLLGQETMPAGELPGGCAVDGVEQRQVGFIAHERLYTAFLAHRGYLFEWRPGSRPASLELRCLAGWLVNGLPTRFGCGSRMDRCPSSTDLWGVAREGTATLEVALPSLRISPG